MMDEKGLTITRFYFSILVIFSPLLLQTRCFGEAPNEAQIVSVRPTELEEYAFHHPAISPNGKQIAFSVSKHNNWNNNTIWVQDLDSGKSWSVTQPDSTVQIGDVCVRWSPDSTKLSFASDKNGEVHIYVVNVDGSDLVQITEDPISNGLSWFGISSWSKDGKKIVYAQNKTDIHSSGIHEYDLVQNMSKVLHEFPNKNVFDADLSPDGNRVVYIVGEELEVLDLTTKATRTLECDVSGARMPKWSPDGQWIGFQVNSGTWKTYLLPHDGGQAIRVGPGKNYWTQVPSWSSDGKKIVYHGKKYDTRRVVIQELENGKTLQKSHNARANNELIWAVWSEDEHYLAYITTDLEKDVSYDLNILDLRSDSFRKMTVISKMSDLKYPVPNWKSKIGRWFADNERFVTVIQNGEYTQLSLISTETLEVKNLTDSPTVKSNLTLSSDEELIAYTSNFEGQEEIWIYDMVTEESYQLTFMEDDIERGATFGGKWSLAFSPSGSKVLFGQDNGVTGADVMMVDIDNGEVTQITSEFTWDLHPNWIDDVTVSYTTHPENKRHIAVRDIISDRLKIITSDDADINNPFWHARTKTFYFNYQRDGEGIMTANMNSEFTTLFTYGNSAVPSPSGKYVAYFKRIGETAPMDIWMEDVSGIVSKNVIP